MKSGISTKSSERIDTSEELFIFLTEILNRVHNKSYSERFYRIFLEDHIRVSVNYIELLNSNNLSATKPHNVSLSLSLKPPYLKKRNQFKQIVKYLISKKNLSKRYDILNKYNHITIGFQQMEKPVNSRKCIELPEFTPYIFGSGENDKRRKLNRIAADLDSSFKRNVVRLLPEIAVEHFNDQIKNIQLFQPEQKVFHSLVLRFTVYDSLFVAKYVENGAKLYWYQDGIEPAVLETKYSRWYHYSVSDEYRTWGWKERAKDIPWKSYPLIKFRTAYEKKYVNKPAYDLLLCYPVIQPGNRKLHILNTKILLDVLDKIKFSSILARPYPKSGSSENIKQLHFIDDPRVDISTALTPIIDEILNSKLVIQMEIPSTNFTECIVVEHPTIGLLQIEQPTKLAEPYYNYFLQKKLFHRNSESLANHLNYSDLQQWWNNLMENETMIDYKQKFARLR